MSSRRHVVTICCLLSALAVVPPAAGQVLDSASGTLPGAGLSPSEVEHDKSLRIQLDRTEVRAFEPVYLAVTSKRFLTEASPEISVWQGDATPTPIAIDEKAWLKGETLAGGDVELLRQGVALQLRSPASGKDRPYLFAVPGVYQLRVKVGVDAATLKVKVIPTEPRERDAWDMLGHDVGKIINNGIREQPEQALVYSCTRVMRTFPNTTAAGYCQAYLSISKFKIAFSTKGKGGDKTVYAPIASELRQVREAFSDGFMGEQLAFYTGYALGLTKDYNGMMLQADTLKTHVTPYSDGLAMMKMEVVQHTMNVIPVDPPQPGKPTTGPATSAPAK